MSNIMVKQKTIFAVAMFIALNPLLFGGEPISKEHITGLWVRSTSDNNPEMIYIDEDKFSVLLNNSVYVYPWFLSNDFIMLPSRLGERGIKYKLKENRLTLEWDSGETTKYLKSPANNTLDDIVLRYGLNVELPTLIHYKVIENLNYYSTITVTRSKNGSIEYYVDYKRIDLNDLNYILSVRKGKINTFERNSYAVLLQIDKNIPMSIILELRNKIAWTTLNYGYVGYPDDEQLSELIFNRNAIMVKMPPPDKPETDKSLYTNTGINFITINVDNLKNSMESLPDLFKEQLAPSKYMVSIEYNKDTSYEDYIKILGLVHGTIYSLRNDLSMEMYNVPYEDLGERLKLHIRGISPIAIAEKYLPGSDF
jgi:biopolymer transport protein ExbD